MSNVVILGSLESADALEDREITAAAMEAEQQEQKQQLATNPPLTACQNTSADAQGEITVAQNESELL